LEPQEFEKLVQSVRTVEMALGKPTYRVVASESENKVFRRSLFVVKDIKKGDIFTSENVRSIRPGYGLETKHLKSILGKVASKDIERGTPLTEKSIK
jgi:pseudaminic acid synthase